jgi:hypothetical protein
MGVATSDDASTNLHVPDRSPAGPPCAAEATDVVAPSEESLVVALAHAVGTVARAQRESTPSEGRFIFMAAFLRIG